MRRPGLLRLLLAGGGLLLLVLALAALDGGSPALRRRLPVARWGPAPSSLDRFEYLRNDDVCGAGEPVTAVVVVHSDPRHPEVRHAIRRSLPTQLLRRLGVRRAFMLADASQRLVEGETVAPQSTIVKESDQYKDIVQGNFHDSYRNLTYKHIMALDWANTFCPQARFIIKMDDDIVYDVFELLKVLQFIPDAKYLGGNGFFASPPYRGNSKWHVSSKEWARELYPPYLSGWLYIVTPDVARALVLQSTVVPFFWIDDTYVTGILAEQLPVTIRNLKKLFATTDDCVKRVVNQSFSLDRESAAPVYRPGFVVAPSNKDLPALEAFNLLTRYCQMRRCETRPRLRVCLNRL